MYPQTCSQRHYAVSLSAIDLIKSLAGFYMIVTLKGQSKFFIKLARPAAPALSAMAPLPPITSVTDSTTDRSLVSALTASAISSVSIRLPAVASHAALNLLTALLSSDDVAAELSIKETADARYVPDYRCRTSYWT